MRILMIHKFFHRATSTGYMFDLSKMMEKSGNEVIHFATQDPRNELSKYSKYFVSYVDFNAPSTFYQKVKNFSRAIYSKEARSKLECLIKDTKPDVAFLHSIASHLSPSVLLSLKRHKIPTVMHVQDYFLICPNYSLLSHGKLCEKCKGHRYYNAPIQRCYRNSFFRSLIMAFVLSLHRFTKIYERNIDYFICPSEFLLQKMVDFGIDRNKLIHIPQAISVKEKPPCFSPGKYILYFGWLRPEKGVETLIRAMETINGTQLRIVGDGEQRIYLEKLIKSNTINNVTLCGPRFGQELIEIIGGALCVVVPSEWYEVYGMTTYEAFALGKPVIGSRIGGTPELIDDGINGFLFEPHNEEDLRSKIKIFIENPELAVEMGKNARRKVEQELSAENNYHSIMSLFKKNGDKKIGY